MLLPVFAGISQRPFGFVVTRRDEGLVDATNGVLAAQDAVFLSALIGPPFGSRSTYQADATRASSSATMASFFAPLAMPLPICT